MNKSFVLTRITAFLLFLISVPTFGQDPFLDSLNTLLDSNLGDSVRASVLGDLCWHYKYSDAPKAIAYGMEAAAIAEKHGYDQLLAYAYNNVGIVYWAKSDYDSASFFILKTQELYTRLNNERGMAVSSTNLGLIYQNKGAYDKSLEYQLEALRIAEKLEDNGLKGGILTNVGNVYFLSKNYQTAKEYYFESLIIKRHLTENHFRQNLQKTLLNIGNVYDKLTDLDSAIFYFYAAEPFAKKAEDYKNLSLVYTDLGYAYSKKEQYDSARHYFKKALQIFNEAYYENDYDQSILLWSLAENELRMKNLPAAVRFGENSLSLSKSLKSPNRLKDIYELLAKIYETDGQLQKALDASKNFRIYQDSVLDLETNKEIATLEKKYETEKKDNEIQSLNHENELQKATNTRNTVIIIALFLIVILLLLVFYFWRQQSKARQQEVLNEQKVRMREAQIRAVISSEEKERKRFASDLHDSMGQLISALSLNIQSLQTLNGDHKKRDEVFDNSMHILGDIQQEIRNIAFNLMPHVLTKEGLTAALKELVNRLNKSHRIKAELTVFGISDRFNEVYEISLYRILQEWVSNILKYGNATNIYIQFTEHDEEVIITVEDNGDGFNLKTLEEGKGNGWKNINTRRNLIHADLDIDSQQGRKNTTLIISFEKEQAFKHQLLKNTDE